MVSMVYTTKFNEMKRKFELTFENEVHVIEINSEFSFGVMEAKKWIKEQHPKVKSIKHIKK